MKDMGQSASRDALAPQISEPHQPAVSNSEQGGWRPISTAPRDGTDILVWHSFHGAISARFSEGIWSDHHEYGRQYDGAMWILGDDMAREEVEEFPDGRFGDWPITHWQPAPIEPEANHDPL